MFNRLPKRPTKEEFMAAANRFSKQSYDDNDAQEFIVQMGYITHVFRQPNQRLRDIELIQKEWAAEGYGDPGNDILVFAKYQLEKYKKLSKTESQQND